MHIYYIDRESGKKEKEEVYGETAILLLYGSSFLAKTAGCLLRWLISSTACFSRFYGWLQSQPCSKKKIAPFIKKFGIDVTEFAEPPESFSSFNDFFIRKLKPSSRPIVPGHDRAVMPADGRYRFFPLVDASTQLSVKRSRFCLETLLHNKALAKKYEGGSLVLARLCPTDCHRFYFPIDCTPSQPKLINDKLYSVNPIATRHNPWIWSENKRVLTLLQSNEFGTVACIEVGATSVGTIIQTFIPNTFYRKGQEKGYFSFGGSAMVLLFEKNAISFDEDLLEKTDGLEVRCLIGQSLGKRK